MPSCCAINCNNSTIKGYKIYNLPNGKTDFQRRQVWLSNIKRADFTPPKRAGLCKDHFDSDQFERRIPGKLKWNAIPTIFNYTVNKVASVSSRGRVIRPKKPFDPDGTSDNEETSVEPPATVSDYQLEDLIRLEDASTSASSPVSTEKASRTKRIAHSVTPTIQKNGDKDFGNDEEANVDDPDKVEDLSAPPLQRLRKRVKRLDIDEDSFWDSDQSPTSNDVSAVTWSEAAIKRAHHLRFSCGFNGYNALREQGLPLPSDDTLRRKLETIPFHCGLLTDIFNLLQSWVQSLDEPDKKVSLVIDELPIQPSIDYDVRAEGIIGFPTIPENKPSNVNGGSDQGNESEGDSSEGSLVLATHAIVFTVQGLSTYWKQTVAYQLVGNSFNPSDIKSLISDVIRKCHDIGLEVKNVIMDVGENNEAIMNEFGIGFGNILDVANIVSHPAASKSRLYLFSSFPNLLKCLRNRLIAGEDFFLPEDVVAKYSLPTNVVSLTHVKHMMTANRDNSLKHAARLENEHLDTVHFDKLKESSALCLLGREAASALRTMVGYSYLLDEALTTAWFFDQVSMWYETVTARTLPATLLQFSVEKLNASVKSLNDFILLIVNMKIGSETAAGKHVQKEILISTTSATAIRNDLLENGDCIDGFNQNFLESLFSIVRFRNSVPTALEFKNALRLISLSQLLKGSSHGSYTADPTLNMPISALRHVDVSAAIKLANSNKITTDMQFSELRNHTLYNLCVYCVTRYIRFSENCDTCVNFIIARGNPCNTSPILSDLTPEHCYSPDSYMFASLDVFHYLQCAEESVICLQSLVINCDDVLPLLTEHTMEKSKEIVFPDCHAVKEKLLECYLWVRCYSFLKDFKTTT